ncbi:hypothetical protein BCR36DRAFT_402915 [Piromyces finnis]|uniref:PQ-loop-domain-containing protein n=1 Tax=Piromyces finnis TaxID=1754191 RepID=A0A1Y1VFV0_9FUNG|nr:hypothetical protein BCR36DRAFT_402915 [Piromyces finnis]|eukprot:ORX55296.1 hypothetical protein BCR36DRAFT_402915 [Piromyces finnis]
MDINTFIQRVIQVSMVVFPVSPYYDQYKKLKHDPEGKKGFSRHVCGLLLIANVFKMFFWYGKRFDITLLCQSISMFIVQFILIHASKLDMRIIYLKTGKEWIYKSFTLYLVLIILISIVLSILGYYFNNSYVYLEIIGFIGISIEAAVPIPQAIRNYNNKSVKGFSKMVLIVWFTGDICKVCYHGFMHTPHQFFLCGLFQLFMDVVITSQWLYYSGSGVDWYDCYARKYGLYYVNEDMDDDEYSEYSFDNNSYQKCNTSSSSFDSNSFDYSSGANSTNMSPISTLKVNDHDGNGKYSFLKNKDDNMDHIIGNTKTEDNGLFTSNIQSSSNNKENLSLPIKSPYDRKNSQSSVSTFFSAGDEATGNDGDIEKESDEEDQRLIAVASANYATSDIKNDSPNNILNTNEDIDYEKCSTVQSLNSSIFTNKKDQNYYNYISDHADYSSCISDVDRYSPLSPPINGLSEDPGFLTDPNNQKRTKHHNHRHHRHSNNSSAEKSKHTPSLSTKRSKGNYGIDKSIFEYLQDGYGKLNPRLNEISFNNKTSITRTTTASNATDKTKINNLSSSNNDIMISIPDNSNNNNNSNDSNDNVDNNRQSPTKKLISNIVKKTFKNIVRKKKEFPYNQLEDENNNNDVELDSYEYSNQYSEQDPLKSLESEDNSNSNSNDNFNFDNKKHSNVINTNKENPNINSIDTINNQTKKNSYESLLVPKSQNTEESPSSFSNIQLQLNDNQNKIIDNSKPPSLSNKRKLHIQTQITTNNENTNIETSAVTPHSSMKSSTISTIISHTKPIGAATSKLISSSSAVINNTINNMQNTKRAKAKANAEAAFQAEIDTAFDGDDFDRDIRDGIGFNSIKNKSYNRKKEHDSNVSCYSSVASVDSSTEVRGQTNNFKNKLKTWTGFTINEVDYTESESKTPKVI